MHFQVKEWLLEAGLIIELDGLGAKIIGKAPFLVVAWNHFGSLKCGCFLSEPKLEFQMEYLWL